MFDASLTTDTTDTALNIHPSDRPKAYSYLRFSTPEQMKGDSYRRQTEAAERFAAQHGLELDDTLRLEDRGISAFRAKNVRQGALGQFLAAIDDGEVEPGSFLLVENLDRVSRADPWEALPVFQQVINAGVTIVTLQDGRTWSRDELRENPFRIFESLMVMIRANEESRTKSRRLCASWAGKRAKAAEKPLTARAPAWLTLGEDGTWNVIQDRAEVVQRIYRDAAAGKGQHSIAETLNREGVPTFGVSAGWHRSYIKKILENDAVVGIMVPHRVEHVDGKKRRVPLDPIKDYFPKIISEEAWEAVRSLQGMRQPTQKKGAGYRGDVKFMLAGLARCPLCGGSMTRVMKGKKSAGPVLVCSNAKRGLGCQYRAVRLSNIETAMVENVSLWTDAPVGDADLDALVAEAEQRAEIIGDQIAHVLEMIAAGIKSPSLKSKLVELEGLREVAEEDARAVAEKARAASPDGLQKRITGLLRAIEALRSAGEDGECAGEVNTHLRRLVDGVVVDYTQGRLVFRWKQGGETGVQFAMPSKT